MKSRVIVFTGSTASGKSTQMYLLCSLLKRWGEKCLRLSVAPFSNLLILKLIKKVAESSYPIKITDKSDIAFIEAINPKLLERILSILVFINFVKLVFITLIVKILNTLGIIVLIEDYAPQMILDHLLYSKLYKDSNTTVHNIIVYIESKVVTKLLKESFFIHVYATSVERARRRSLTEVVGFYNEVTRSKLVISLYKKVSSQYIVVDTTNKTPLDTFFEIYARLPHDIRSCIFALKS